MLADHHRAALLSGDQEADVNPAELTNVQTERLVRAEALSAFHTFADEDEEEGDFQLKPRKGGDDQIKEEDDGEYRRFMLEMGGGEEEIRRVLGTAKHPATRFPSNGGLDEDDDAASEAEEKRERPVTKGARDQKVEEDDDFLMKWVYIPSLMYKAHWMCLATS